MSDDEREIAAKQAQKETIESHRYLFSQGRDGEWWFNRDGTVLTPVWVRCSSYETALLNAESEPRGSTYRP